MAKRISLWISEVKQAVNGYLRVSLDAYGYGNNSTTIIYRYKAF